MKSLPPVDGIPPVSSSLHHDGRHNIDYQYFVDTDGGLYKYTQHTCCIKKTFKNVYKADEKQNN